MDRIGVGFDPESSDAGGPVRPDRPRRSPNGVDDWQIDPGVDQLGLCLALDLLMACVAVDGEEPLPGRGMRLTMMKADHSFAGFIGCFCRRTAVTFATLLLPDRNLYGEFASM
jgi:hypothetical protein